MTLATPKRSRLILASLSLIAAFAVDAQTDHTAVDHAAVDRAKSAFVERMAAQHGFAPDELTATLADVEINAKILETIARPAERVVPWYEYRGIFLTDQRIAAGAEFWHDHAAEIAAASEHYGVAPEMLVSIIGIETLFGQRMGNYRVLDALATLAFAYPPRADFFASELESFLLLGREEGVDLSAALGSYAGAMGAGQFIPSSFRAYAVDANDDGRRNLWQDWEDILASVANYFDVHGWQQGQPVADPATRSAAWSGHTPENSMDLEYTVASLEELGYAFSSELDGAAPATVLALEAGPDSTEYWVGYHNFWVITRYNRSVKYALAAHQLSQAISAEYQQGNER